MFKYKKITTIILFLLLTFSSSYADHDHRTNVIKKILPAVVEVIAQKEVAPVNQENGFQFRNKKPGLGNDRNDREQMERDQFHSGTGFVISSDGYVLTNSHVINNVKEAGKITLRFYNDVTYEATLINFDDDSDLALLKIIQKSKAIVVEEFPFVTWGKRPELGENTIAIGSPLNLSFSVTRGIVSALDRFIPNLPSFVPYIQTDASINPGNSGGPLFNEDGEVIGINTLIMSNNRDKQSSGSIGLGFAVDGIFAQEVVKRLMTGEKIIRPYMGIMYRVIIETDIDVYKEGIGVIIQEIVPSSPAGQYLRVGDVLLKMNGENIKWRMLATKIKNKKVGEIVLFDIVRDGKHMKIEFKLGRKK